jgi:tRNA G10  N-methylase Trm11
MPTDKFLTHRLYELHRNGSSHMLKSHKKSIKEILGRSPIHPFPARMAAGIALEALGDSKTVLRVLDPMVGSGTVLALACANGHRALGVDIDPLAVLLANVWIRPINAGRVRTRATEALDKAKGRFRKVATRNAYPAGHDDETQNFIRYWFDPYARRQLAALSSTISKISNESERDVLWCAFSRLIITKQAGASLAMDLSHSRPHRKFTRAPIKPFDHFLSAVETIISNCPQSESETPDHLSAVTRGDARSLTIDDGAVDLVLTSPPYLNAIDYMRCSKFTLVWMGYTVSELRQIRGESVGAEASSKNALDVEWVTEVINRLKLKPALSSRNSALLARYVSDIGRALSETARVLRSGGRAVYVVGDSTIRGTFIRNSVIVSTAAERHGLSLQSRHYRTLPANRRYLPPPKRGSSNATMDTRMRREVVIAFTKP